MITVVKTAPVSITGVFQKTDGRFRMTWTGQPGKSYCVQYKDSLAETGWTTLDAKPGAVDANLWTIAAPANAPQRFYRILQVE